MLKSQVKIWTEPFFSFMLKFRDDLSVTTQSTFVCHHPGKNNSNVFGSYQLCEILPTFALIRLMRLFHIDDADMRQSLPWSEPVFLQATVKDRLAFSQREYFQFIFQGVCWSQTNILYFCHSCMDVGTCIILFPSKKIGQKKKCSELVFIRKKKKKAVIQVVKY